MGNSQYDGFADRLLGSLDKLRSAGERGSSVSASDGSGGLLVRLEDGRVAEVEVGESLLPRASDRDRVAKAVAEVINAMLAAQAESSTLPAADQEALIRDAKGILASGESAVRSRLSEAEALVARLQSGPPARTKRNPSDAY